MIILASQSPRRNELMKKYITSSFQCVVSHAEEINDKRLPPEEIAKINALRKGIDVAKLYPNDTIVSADTIVVFDNIIYGKPKSKDDARRILSILSGNTHKVITGYFIKHGKHEVLKTVTSLVKFYKLDEKLINQYIETGSPMDKAGAYGIQDEYSNIIVESYIGSLTNIIGFPVDEIKKDLENL